jgi:hypothetical protein
MIWYKKKKDLAPRTLLDSAGGNHLMSCHKIYKRNYVGPVRKIPQNPLSPILEIVIFMYLLMSLEMGLYRSKWLRF